MKLFFGKIDIGLLKNMFARFIVVTMILPAAAFVMPGFEIEKFISLLIASVVIITFDFFIEIITNMELSMIGRVILVFLLALIILYLLQFFNIGYKSKGLTTVFVSLTLGIVSGIIPQTAYKKE